MKNILFRHGVLQIGIGCILINSQLFAATPPSIQCPKTELIKVSQWQNAVRQNQSNLWSVLQAKNYYETDREWEFSIDGINADSESAAKLEATKIVDTFSSWVFPLMIIVDGRAAGWSCTYYGKKGINGKAVSSQVL